MKALLSVLARRPGFRWLWLGETTSLVGDWLSYVAVSLLALEAGEGAFALAVVFAAHVMPTALVLPWAGIVADRVDKRRLLVATQLVMAGLMAAMVVAASLGALWAVQLLLLSRTTFGAFLYPARNAALPELVHADELVDANAIDTATWSATFALGTAAGGLLALADPVLALALDGLTFLVAAAAFTRLPSLPPVATAPAAGRPRLSELATAFSRAWARPALLEAVLTKAPLGIAAGAAWLLLNLTAGRLGLWGSAALALGALQAIRGVGSGVGPLASRSLLARGWSPRQLLRGSALVTLASIAAFTVVASLDLGWAALAVAALAWGVGAGGQWVFAGAELQRRSPPEVLGRLASIDMLTFALGEGTAALVAGWLVDVTGQPALAGWLGVGVGGAAYLALRLALPKRSSRLRPALRTA